MTNGCVRWVRHCFEGACDCDERSGRLGDCGRQRAGCNDSGACNYDAVACGDFGSCEFDVLWSCTDPVARNYRPNHVLDDGSCDYCFHFQRIEYDTDPVSHCGETTLGTVGLVFERVEALNKCFISTPGHRFRRLCRRRGLACIFEKGQEVALVLRDELEYWGHVCHSSLGSNVGLMNLQNAACPKRGPPFSSTTWAYGR